jgi:hypothetical protein
MSDLSAPEPLVPSCVEFVQADGCLHYRIQTYSEARTPEGNETGAERSQVWWLWLIVGMHLFDGSLNWLISGLFIPCGFGSIQALIILPLWWETFRQRESEREVILMGGWIGFRFRLGGFRWTKWLELRRLERFVVRMTEDDQFFEEFLLAVAGRRVLSFTWFGGLDDLKKLANHLAAQCERLRGGGPLGWRSNALIDSPGKLCW